MVGRGSHRLVVVALAALLLTGACGGDTTVPPTTGGPDQGGDTTVPPTTGGPDQGGDAADPQTYARDVCGAISAWNAGFGEAFAEVGGGGIAKDQFGQALDSLVANTDQLIEDVEGAGVPDVEGGEEFAASLSATATDVRTTLEGARAQVEALPDVVDTEKEQEAFNETLTQVSESVESSVAQIQGSLSGDVPPDLAAAFEDEPTCQFPEPTIG